MKRRMLFLIAGIALIAASGFYLIDQALTQHQELTATEQRVDAFIESLPSNSSNSANNNNESASTDQDGSASNTSVHKYDDATIGVLTLETMDRTFPVALQDSNNIDTINALLKTHAVMYADYGTIGSVNNNAVIVAHSAINDLGCGHCYFDNIESLQKDDRMTYIDRTGTVYVYKVVEILDHLDPNDTAPYASKMDQNSWLTLITCTDGDSSYRTAVQAVLIDHFDYL